MGAENTLSAGWGQHGVGDGISEKWITRARAGPTERRSVRAGLHMPLAAYYDSSADRGRQVVTLTGVAARCVIWESFERNWLGVLKSYSVPALHMNKLMHFRGDFKAENGWNERRRSQFLGELWNVIGSFRMQHLVAYSCSVLTDDWSRARSDLPSLVSPESMCVNFCVGGLHLPIECQGESKPVLLYFDRNEQFMHKVNRVWVQQKKRSGTLFSQIRNITAVDSTKYPIQAADLLAWIENKEARGEDYPFKAMLRLSRILMIEHVICIYDYRHILLDYPNGRLKPQESR